MKKKPIKKSVNNISKKEDPIKKPVSKTIQKEVPKKSLANNTGKKEDPIKKPVSKTVQKEVRNKSSVSNTALKEVTRKKPLKNIITKGIPIIKKKKLKSIKTIKPINFEIEEIYIFENKNFMIVAGSENTVYIIYNERYIKIKQENFHYYINNIKIIDNSNFICLKNNTKLINILIKDEKIKLIFDFKEEIDKILYYKNKYITKAKIIINGIKIWETLDNGNIQLVNKIGFNNSNPKDFYEGIINLIPDKNLLIYSGETRTISNEVKTCFWNLKIFKLENELQALYELIFRLNKNLFILTSPSWGENEYDLEIFDISQKKFVNNIKLKFKQNSIEVIPKKELILISGFDYNGYGVACNEYCDIHIFDYNFKEKQVLTQVHYRSIVGMKYYEKNENGELVLSYSEDGSINILLFY